MAHNLKPNYSASSDDEEEEQVSDSEDEQSYGSDSDQRPSDSDSDDDKKQTTKKPLNPPPQSSNKSQKPDLSSSESEDSGSETDSDSPPKKSGTANPNIKPISSKPMEGSNLESKSAKKPGSKPSSTQPPAKTKRPPPSPATTSEKDAKKAKKSTTTDEDSKKQLFQRLWSEDDEIVILKGMIDYKREKNGKDPVADMTAFHEFIKKALHVDVTRAQLADKVRRLRKKYENNFSKEKNGKDRSFSKSHEQKGYDLSKLIWGGISNSFNSGTESKKNQKNGNAKGNHASTSTPTSHASTKANGVDDKEASTMEVEKTMDISRFVQYGRTMDGPILPEEIVKAGLELLEGSKREELEAKWKKLKMQELQLFAQRMDLLKEQTALVLEAVNSSGS